MHNVRNAAAALGVLQALGADVQLGADVLAAFQGVWDGGSSDWVSAWRDGRRRLRASSDGGGGDVGGARQAFPGGA